ncbi:MAG: endolytic transglycosylase MltG [Woeseiaceae bacterium]|nr:endolytic transglycosylase MltG [Woeseiaceae bacterium]
MSRVVSILLGLAAAIFVAAAILAFQFSHFISTPVSVAADGAELVIPPGVAFRQVSDELSERGIISHPTWFRLYARLSGNAASIHAGEYLVESGITPAGLIDKFVSGDVLLYSFTIVEGWTFRDLLAALAADEVVQQTLTFEDWPDLLELIGAWESHPEGLFLPETYLFPKGTSDVDILRQSYRLMYDVLAEQWDARSNNLPITNPYAALILASIVEKETALAVERPRIAGVFIRRLLAGMRLQTDPTVIYGIGPDFNGNLTRRDLRTDTPYNTYTRGGLPPTPIALTGRAAINAVLHPAGGTELYFVATGLGDGSHKFSDTKEQHDRAVQEYLARQRAGRDEGQ